MKRFLHYDTAAVLIVSISLAAAALFIALRVNRNTELKFCRLVVSVSDGYRITPPTTPAGRGQAARWEQLRSDLHCPARVPLTIAPRTAGGE